MDKITAKLIMIKPYFPNDYEHNILTCIDKYYDAFICDIKNTTLIVSSFYKDISPYYLKFKYIKYRGKSFLNRKMGTLSISYYIDIEKANIECSTICGDNKVTEYISDLQMKKELLIIEFEQILHNIIFALNLSSFGMLNISEESCIYGKSAFYINNKRYKETHIGNLLFDDMYRAILKEGWPCIYNIPFRKSWNWLQNKTHFMDRKPKSKIDRALNALTYLYNCRAYEDIFYSLMGIEALYNCGKGKIRKQIEKKVRLILGNYPNLSFIIKNMYDIRSDFFHGRFNINKSDCDDYPLSYNTKKYFQCVNTAILILISTIQKMITSDCSSVDELLKQKFKT